jgi:holo-[acyl-carrier protein] synthase
VIHGIGTDIVAVARIARAMERHEGRFTEKVLAPAEREACAASSKPASYLAKRFAAKEAFFKAFGEPPSEANTWHQLAILNDESGKPRMEFGPLLAGLMRARGVARWHISLSDEHDYALAYVVLEKTEAEKE